MSSLPAVTYLDLQLPTGQQIDAVMDGVDPDGAQVFVAELIDALREMKDRHGDLRPVQEVVEAWYGTLLFVKKHPNPEPVKALKKAIQREQQLTFDEVKARLGT